MRVVKPGFVLCSSTIHGYMGLFFMFMVLIIIISKERDNLRIALLNNSNESYSLTFTVRTLRRLLLLYF